MPLSAYSKKSLPARVAQVLLDHIEGGELVNPLPGEHELAEQLGVSRPTLRKALAILAAERIVETAKGRRTRILFRKKTALRIPGRRVCAIGCLEHRLKDFSRNTLIHQIRLRLAEEGIAWEECSDRKLTGRGVERYLKEVTVNRPHTCWLLIGSPLPVQAFFASIQEPVLNLGSNFAGIHLPALDWDYEAIGRHAAHTLLRSNVRRIALLVPDPLLAGDAKTIAGFKEAVGSKRAEVVTSVFKIHENRMELQAICDRMLVGSSQPEAVFVFRARFAFALLTRALQRGIRIPEHLSLLCRDDHSVFEALFPAVDRYGISESRFVHSAMRMIHRLMEGQRLEKKEHFIMPERINGETLRTGL